jgi:hypothetical protein
MVKLGRQRLEQSALAKLADKIRGGQNFDSILGASFPRFQTDNDSSLQSWVINFDLPQHGRIVDGLHDGLAIR